MDVEILDQRDSASVTGVERFSIAHTRGRKLVMGVSGFEERRYLEVFERVRGEVKGLPGAVVVLHNYAVSGWARV